MDAALGAADDDDGKQAQLRRYAADLRATLAERDEAFRMMERYVEELRLILAEKETALSRAQAAEAAQSRFLANLSDELRSPLTTICGLADYGLRTLNGEAECELLGRVRASARQMDGLITNLIELGRGSGRSLRATETISLATWIPATLARQIDQASACGMRFQFQVEDPSRLATDTESLARILEILCGNAIRHVARGVVTVSTESDVLGRCVGISVQDEGPGIDAERVGNLFALPGARTPGSETGFGLAFARILAERLPGNLTYAAAAGGGARFDLRFI